MHASKKHTTVASLRKSGKAGKRSEARAAPMRICEACTTLRLIDITTLYLLDKAAMYSEDDVNEMPLEISMRPVLDVHNKNVCLADIVFKPPVEHDAKKEDFGLRIAKKEMARTIVRLQQQEHAAGLERAHIDAEFAATLHQQITLGCEKSADECEVEYRNVMRTFSFSSWFTLDVYRWRARQQDRTVTLGDVSTAFAHIPFPCALTIIGTPASDANLVARVMVRDVSVRNIRAKQRRGEIEEGLAHSMVQRMLQDNDADVKSGKKEVIRSHFFAPSSLPLRRGDDGDGDQAASPSLEDLCNNVKDVSTFEKMMRRIDNNVSSVNTLMCRWRRLVAQYVYKLHTAVVVASTAGDEDSDAIMARCDLHSRQIDLDEFVRQVNDFCSDIKLLQQNTSPQPFLLAPKPSEMSDPREVFKHTATEVYEHCCALDAAAEEQQRSVSYDDSCDEGESFSSTSEHSQCNSECDCESPLRSEDEDWMYAPKEVCERKRRRAAAKKKVKSHSTDKTLLKSMHKTLRDELDARKCKAQHLHADEDVLLDALRKLCQILDFIHLECIVSAAEAHQAICHVQPWSFANGAVARALCNCVLSVCQLPLLYVAPNTEAYELYKNMTAYATQHSTPVTFATYLAEHCRSELHDKRPVLNAHFMSSQSTLMQRQPRGVLLCRKNDATLIEEFEQSRSLWEYCKLRDKRAYNGNFGFDISMMTLRCSHMIHTMKKVADNEKNATPECDEDYYYEEEEDVYSDDDSENTKAQKLLRGVYDMLMRF